MTTVVDLDASADADFIARQVIAGKKRAKRPVPALVDLATAITDIQLDDTMQGSSTLTVTIADPEWDLMESGFFDANEDARLDTIDVNYPQGSAFWWQLTQANPRSDTTIELVFMERAAAHLIAHRGPLKVSRGKKTRAEFLAMLAGHVKAGGGIKFVSKQLHTTQTPRDTEISDADRKAEKSNGISGDEKITFSNWDGASVTLKPDELRNAEKALDAAMSGPVDDPDPPEDAILALLCACIVEAPFFRNPTGGDASSAGMLQLLATHGSLSFRRDIANVVGLFLNKGFTGKGGAIKLASDNSDWSPGRIAQEVQGSAHPDRYDKVIDGAKKVLEAYGGAGTNLGTYRKQYNFEVGSPNNPRETYWDAMNRLADEVKWPLFLNGQYLYFDSEMTLIKQKPATVITRTDPSVMSWDCVWDARNIATEMRLDLICDPFEFRAGDVFKLLEFGPASSGSTAKLPGRWLVSEISRSRFSLASSFTLKQPERPDPEPVSELAQRQQEDVGSVTGSGELFSECKRISDDNRKYVWGGGHQGKKLSAITDDEGLDCSGSVCLALKRAGMFPGDVAIVSGAFNTWGEAGKGDEWSVYYNGGHVFIQSEGSGRKWRFDTGGGPPDGPHVRDGWRNTTGYLTRRWKSPKGTFSRIEDKLGL